MQIGDKIKFLRKEIGLTQAEFANKIGLKQAAIGLFENGTRNVTDRNIISICEAFGVNEDWLRGTDDQMYRESNTDNGLAIEVSRLLSSDDEWTKNAVLQFLKLPSERREAIKNFIIALNEKTPE